MVDVEWMQEEEVLIGTIAAAVVVMVILIWCLCCRGKQTRVEIRAIERQKVDAPQFKKATSSSEKLLRSLDIGMTQDSVLPQLGSRRRKVWFQLLSKENYNRYLMSMAQVPACHGRDNTSCRDHVIQQFKSLQKLYHRHLQSLQVLCVCSKNGEVLAGGVAQAGGPDSSDVRGSLPVLKVEGEKEMPEVTDLHVAVVETFHEEGSLKDYMHGVSPNKERNEKYGGSATPRSASKVAEYGRQILQAILYLYDELPSSMIPIGHVRIENIYMKKRGFCVLGGYENTIMGYGNWLQNKIKEAGHTQDTDVIMFGHVIYYMCTGGDMKTEKLITVLPSEENLSAVTNEKCKELLEYIFKMKNNKIKHSIKEISKHKFFSSDSSGGGVDPVADSDENRNRGRMAKAKEKTKNILRTRLHFPGKPRHSNSDNNAPSSSAAARSSSDSSAPTGREKDN